MRAFSYVSPTKKEDAVGLLGKTWGEGEILAGGSDLLSLMKDEIVAPKTLVNIKQLPGLHAISNEGGGMRLGAPIEFAEGHRFLLVLGNPGGDKLTVGRRLADRLQQSP